jgi:hypothetical protein
MAQQVGASVGVLISTTGCLLRAPRCRTAAGHDSGAYLVVQPCDLDGQPRHLAIFIVPVLSGEDTIAVADWLAGGGLDRGPGTALAADLATGSRPRPLSGGYAGPPGRARPESRGSTSA